MQNSENIENPSCDGFELNVGDIIDWKREAIAIIHDVEDYVTEIFVSKKVTSNNFHIFINVKTLESLKYCIEVSGSGFRIAGYDYDKTDLMANIEEYYETPYALLTKISQRYVESFAKRLSQEINSLAES